MHYLSTFSVSLFSVTAKLNIEEIVLKFMHFYRRVVNQLSTNWAVTKIAGQILVAARNMFALIIGPELIASHIDAIFSIDSLAGIPGSLRQQFSLVEIR